MQSDVIYVDEKGNRVNPPGDEYSYPPSSFSQDHRADLLDKIKPDLIVETMRHKLMGEELINGKWIKMPNLQDRALTSLGAWDVSNIMLGVSSQNVSLSKLKDNEIKARTLEIVKTVQHMLLKNWKEYGITGTDQLEFVHQIVMSNTFITLKQPENGGIRDLIKNTTHEDRKLGGEENHSRWNPFRR